MRKLSVVLGAIAIFLLGALVSFLVTRELYHRGTIFIETSISLIPQPRY
jgi:hypothetical protein